MGGGGGGAGGGSGGGAGRAGGGGGGGGGWGGGGAIDISPHLVFFAALTALSPRTPLRAMAFGRTKTTTKTTPAAKGGTAG